MSCAKINYYPSNRVLEMNRIGISPAFYALLQTFKSIPSHKRTEALDLLKEYHKIPFDLQP
jgi:hypothetical protein